MKCESCNQANLPEEVIDGGICDDCHQANCSAVPMGFPCSRCSDIADRQDERDAKDSERLDWMERNCADWKDCELTYYPTNSALEWETVDTCGELREAIDEAMRREEES